MSAKIGGSYEAMKAQGDTEKGSSQSMRASEANSGMTEILNGIGSGVQGLLGGLIKGVLGIFGKGG